VAKLQAQLAQGVAGLDAVLLDEEGDEGEVFGDDGADDDDVGEPSPDAPVDKALYLQQLAQAIGESRRRAQDLRV
jgi:hypothetical protein